MNNRMIGMLFLALFFLCVAHAGPAFAQEAPANRLEDEILNEMKALAEEEAEETVPEEAPVLAEPIESEPPVAVESLDPKIQDFKEEILELNTLLFRLQEELLFPEESSIVVFLSVEGSHYFKLDAIKLHIDDKMVSSHLYTDREVMALKKGGIQRLYTGNIRSGEHQLLVVFNGIGPQSLDYKRAETITLQKGKGATFIKLIIRDDLELKQPKFTYETW